MAPRRTALLLGIFYFCAPSACRAFDLFHPFASSNSQVSPSQDALAYSVVFTTDPPNREAEAALKEASAVEKLASAPPPDGANLARRVADDLPNLIDALWGDGYFDASIAAQAAGAPVALGGAGEAAAAAAAERLRGRALAPIVFTARLGPRYVFRAVRLFGPDGRPLDPGLAPRTLKEAASGAPATTAAVLAAEAHVVEHLRALSRPLAKILKTSASVDHRAHVMEVAVIVDPGPRAGVGTISIEGLRTIDRKVARSYVYLKTGQPLTPNALRRAERAFSALPAVSAVRFAPGDRLDAQGNAPVTARFSEKLPHVVGFSTLYSTADGPSLNALWGDDNLFGGAESLRLSATAGFFTPSGVSFEKSGGFRFADLTGRLEASFIKPAIDGDRDDLIAEISVERDRTDAYSGDVFDVTTGVRRRFSADFSAQVGVEAMRGWTRDAVGALDFALVGLPASVTYDSTDDRLDPTRGLRVLAVVAPYARAYGPTANFVRGELQASAYQALDSDARVVLADRVTLGAIFGAALADLPDNMRFFAGGGGSVRGYGYQTLAPTAPNGAPIGGRSLFENSIEARVKVAANVGLVPFVDVGSAYASAFPDFDGRLYVGAGLGLRYYTSIGPIRLDFATPLVRVPGQGRLAAYLSIGQAF